MTRSRRSCHWANGQALAEFALAVPIFLIAVLALIDLGRGVFIYSGLTNAVREGARLAVVNQDEDSVSERVQAMSFGVPVDTLPGDLVNYFSPRPNADDVESNQPCDNGGPNPISLGCVAVVQAQATWQPIALAPITGLLRLATGGGGEAPYGAIVLEARSELPIEFECPNGSVAAYTDPASCPRQP